MERVDNCVKKWKNCVKLIGICLPIVGVVLAFLGVILFIIATKKDDDWGFSWEMPQHIKDERAARNKNLQMIGIGIMTLGTALTLTGCLCCYFGYCRNRASTSSANAPQTIVTGYNPSHTQLTSLHRTVHQHSPSAPRATVHQHSPSAPRAAVRPHATTRRHPDLSDPHTDTEAPPPDYDAVMGSTSGEGYRIHRRYDQH